MGSLRGDQVHENVSFMKGPFIKMTESSFAPNHIIYREKIGAYERGHMPLPNNRYAGTFELGLFILQKCKSLL